MKETEQYEQPADLELKEKAIEMVLSGKRMVDVSNELKIPYVRVRGWVRKRKAKIAKEGATPAVRALQLENRRLQKENDELRETAEILKKAAAYLAKSLQ